MREKGLIEVSQGHSVLSLTLLFSLLCCLDPSMLKAKQHTQADDKGATALKSSHRSLITAEQAVWRLKDQEIASRPSLLDARDLWPLYYWSHASSAIHTPWRAFTIEKRSGILRSIDQLERQMRSLGITAERPVIIYGDWDKGWGEEARMLWLLEYLGHPEVYLVEGGWQALKEVGISTTWGRSPLVSPSTWHVSPRPERRALAPHVAQLVSQGQLSIDARSLREFAGETPYGSAYGGHLKGSVHLPWKQLLTAERRLKSPRELRALFLKLGVRPEQEVFAYCTGGIRSAFVYLALREAGFEKAMNYDGSWWEWTTLYHADATPLTGEMR